MMSTRPRILATSPATFVVIPTYNEATNLPAIVAALFALAVDNLHIVVVDDNSPDHTGEVADRLQQTHPRHLHVIHRPGKQGLGSAYRAGFRYALDQGAELIVQMDADFSHSPTYLTEFLRTIKGCDVVVGSRYVSGGRLDRHWSWWRHLLSWWANAIYARVILGLHVKDATAGFKCWRRATLEAILTYPIRSNGYVFQVEMAYLAERLGFRALEIPIYFEDRRAGHSKMSNSVKIEAAWRTWLLRWRYRNVRPLPQPASTRPAALQATGDTPDRR
ncbi:polyprenol monophosphomannose synthase [Candidatus Amarolinea aalborgensis]|jgi:dolichol-phosphate mannosyltransferase|uniref:polyprenol monophosphomannose synthase n=1 Tax=Candidatus Amarolinea aalborgensis TaxID=2249329 RepID=UPI003BF94697